MKMPDYQSQYPITPPRQAAPWQIPHPAPHHHPATTATAAFPAIQCRCGSTFPCRPVLTVFQGGFTVRQDSATAAFPAIRYRCGSTFPCRPVLTAFQGGFTVRQGSATAAYLAIRCRCGGRVVRRRSRPGRLRLMRSHFAMSSISPKFILLIIKDIHFSNLLDPAYFATKRPSSPISSQVQQMSFFRAFDYQAFL